MIIIKYLPLFAISLKRYFNLKRALFIQLTCLALIVLLSAIFANFSADHNAKQQIKLGVIVQDEHQYINLLLSNFTANPQFTALFDIAIDDEAAIKDAFGSGQIDAYVVIPPSFTSNMLSYRDNHLKIYAHLGFPTKTKILKSLFTSYSRFVQTSNATTLAFYDLLTEAALDDEVIYQANKNFSIEIIGLTLGRNRFFDIEERDALAGISAASYFSVALSFAVLGFAMIPLVDASYRDMQRQVGARLLASGLAPSLYLANLHLIQVISALLQTVLLAVLWAFYNGANPLLTVAAFSAMALFWSLLWLTLAIIINNRQLYFVGCAIIAFIFALLGGSITPFTIMPLHLKLLAHYSPILAFSKLGLNIGDGQLLALWLMLGGALFGYQHYALKLRKYEVC